MTTGFSSREVADVAAITYRQLDYWARTGLIRPSLADANGSGSTRRWSYRDVILLRTVRALHDAGLNLDRIRTAFDIVRDLDDLITAQLVIIGTDIEVVHDAQELIDAIRRHQGRGVLNILALASIVEEVDTAIADLGRSR